MLKHAFIFSFCLLGVYCAMSLEMTTVSDTERAQGYACKSSSDMPGLMKPGEVKINYRPNACIRSSCSSDGVIDYATCGIVVGPPECKMVSDLRKPYPDCCPRAVC